MCMLPRFVENQVSPAQGVGGGVWEGQREYRQDGDLRVPEGVTVVARACQPFGRDGSTLRTRSRLQHVEEGEAHRLLDLWVALQLNVCIRPEVVQVGSLLGK